MLKNAHPSRLVRVVPTPQSGFTLLELMLVLAIGSILTAIAITQYLKQLPDIRAKSAARQIWTDIKKAQSYAMSKNADIVVLFDVANSSYKVLIDTGANMGETGIAVFTGTGADQVLIDEHLPPGIIFAKGVDKSRGFDLEAIDDGVVLGNDRVFFQPSGRATVNNEDTADTILQPTRRAIYVIPAEDVDSNRKQSLWAIVITGISGLPQARVFGDGWSG